MNYPAAELRGIKMNFYLINPDAEHRGILLIKTLYPDREIKIPWIERKTETEPKAIWRAACLSYPETRKS
jgi:hypothetical protein